MKIKKLFLFFYLLCLYGISYGQGTPAIPEADLLDVKFQLNGVAIDVSDRAFIVTPGPQTPKTSYDAGIKQYVSEYTPAGYDTEAFYKIDYKGNTDFKNALKAAFTLEVFTKTTTNGAMSSVSSAQSGGFSIEKSYGGETAFYVGASNDYGWCYAGTKSTYEEPPVYYHLVFTFDGSTIKAYYNGIFDSSAPMDTEYKEAPDENAHWIAIGGDASLYELAQNAFTGNIGAVRMYGKALSQDEVTALYDQIETRKAITAVDDLNAALIKFPTYISCISDAAKKTKAEQYQTEGWGLMNSLATTEAEITEFVTKVNTDLDNLNPWTGLPAADLLDVKFMQNGQAKDISAKAWTVATGTGIPATVYDAEIKQYASRFTESGGETNTYYKVDYKDDMDFRNQLKDKFTLEVYTKTNTNGFMSSVSSADAGGFSIEKSDGGETAFYIQVEPGSWNWAGSISTYEDPPQYYHIVFTYDGSSISAYYNGVLDGTSATTGAYKEAADANSLWIAIGGDASNYGVAQAAFNGNIGMVRMYSEALSAEEALALYNQIEARKAITAVDDLNAVLIKFPNYIQNVEDAGNKTKAEQYQIEGWNLMNSLTTTEGEIAAFVEKVNTELDNLDVPDTSLKPIFGAISDIHIGRAGWETRVETALNTLVSHSPKLDAIFVAGDITDWGTQAQYDALKAFVAAKVPLDRIPVFYCMGNHDWLDDWNHEFSAERFKNTLGQDANQFIDIKGYPFIMISMETRNADQAYKEKTRTFLEEKLQYAAQNYPGKPIFLFQHIPNNNTVYGSYTIGGDDAWGTGNIEDIISRYPQLVSISGHTHYPVGDERSIHQDKYTSINDGNIAYAEIENGLDNGPWPLRYEEVIEGCVITIEDNEDITVKRMNFNQNEEIKPQAPWVIKAPHDGTNFTYKGQTGGEKPYFEATDALTLSSTWDAYCDVTFPQAKDDQDVQQYRIEVLDADQNPLPAPKYRLFSNFYLNSETPATMTWTVDISRLTDNTDYYIRVTAIDAFGNESATSLVSEKFTKKEFDMAAPVANMLDVRFRSEGKASDVSESNLNVAAGVEGKLPETLYDPDIQQYVTKFRASNANTDRDTDVFYKVDYKGNTEFKNKLNSGFTLEALVKATSATNNMNSVCATQSGGFGIEHNANGGATEFWMGVQPDGWAIAGNQPTFSADSPAYYHVVYTFDGSQISAYYNGRYNTSAAASGYREAPDENAHWIGIGGDASVYGLAQQAFDGNVAVVRMYDRALSKEEAYACYIQVEKRKGLLLADDLHRLITMTLPNYQPENEDEATQIAALLEEGWALMGDLNTTDPDIEAFRDKAAVYIGSSDVSIHKLTINGQVWDINDTYEISCDIANNELNIGIETEEGAEVSKGHAFTEKVEGYPVKNSIPFTIMASDGITQQEYQLKYSRAHFSFQDIVVEKWGTTLIVNNNSAANHGFSFRTFDWFKNGNPVGTEQVYTEKPGLDPTAVYSLRLTIYDDYGFDVCPSKPTKQVSTLVAYPNPAKAGESITIKSGRSGIDGKNGSVKIYSIAGNPVMNATMNGEETRITAPAQPGTYIIRMNAGNINEEFKLLVK